MADGVLAEFLPPRPGAADYSEDLAQEIIETASVTPRSISWMIASYPHWPSLSTLYGWKAKHPEFRNAFHEARRRLAHELAFEAIEIADDSSGDAREFTRRDGSVYRVLDQEFAQRSQLRVKTRQWMAEKLCPEVYGNNVNMTLRAGPILSQEEALDQLR